ncbi:MAG: hypothetical protein WBD09_09000 [Halobacteriota archaeon]
MTGKFQPKGGIYEPSSDIGCYTQSDFGGQIQNGRRTMSQEGNERRGGRNKGADGWR